MLGFPYPRLVFSFEPTKLVGQVKKQIQIEMQIKSNTRGKKLGFPNYHLAIAFELNNELVG